MRILCLGMYGLAMGELSYEQRMLHYLAERGHQVDYWTDAPISYSVEPVLKWPKNLRNFVFQAGKQSLAKTPRQFMPEDVGRIFREHAKNPYDVIFGTAHTAIDMGTWLKKAINLPLVIQILDVPYWRIDPFGLSEIYREALIDLPNLPSWLFEGYKQEWDYWFSHLAELDAITILISVVGEFINKYSGQDVTNKTHTVFHGSLDGDTFDHYLDKEKVEKKNQVLYLSRLDFHKGPDQAVYIFKLIQDLLGAESPEFLFVSRGNQEWYEQAIQTMASKMLKKYKFLGWVDNPTKIRLLRESKLLVDTEWPEGFGGVVIGESLYCNTPVLAWDRRSKREVYPTGLTMIPKNDYEGMAHKAVEIIRNPTPVSEETRKFIRDYRSNESHAIGIERVLEGFARR